MVMAMLRWLLGVLAGLLAMFVVIMAVEYLGHQAFPPPPGLDPMRTADLAAIMAQQPVAALVFVVVAWSAGAFAGAWVAARISRRWRIAAAVPIALVVMVGVLGMIRDVPTHPQWMAIAGLLLPIPAALLAARLARPRPAAGT